VKVSFLAYSKKEGLQLARENDNRRDARIDHSLPIRIEDVETGINYKAEMINFNKNGMYFETDMAFQPGVNIFIGIENSPYTSESDDYECYRTEIIWRRKLIDSFYNYGYGVRFIIMRGLQNSEIDNYKDENDQRRHQRRPYSKIISFSIQGRSYKGVTNNISPCGVFMETKNSFPVGERLTVAIPLKGGKEAKYNGQIVWTNNEGFGVRFMNRINK
jgi:Tfp pilus assembly protein PilZ